MKKFLSLCFALCFTSSFASPGPEVCPSASAIKSTPIMAAVDLGGYFVSSFGTYDTQDLWGFVIGIIEANSEEEAIEKGALLMKNLSGTPIPHQDSDNEQDWSCEYTLPGDYIAIAVTMPGLSKDKLAQYIKKK